MTGRLKPQEVHVDVSGGNHELLEGKPGSIGPEIERLSMVEHHREALPLAIRSRTGHNRSGSVIAPLPLYWFQSGRAQLTNW